jgi:hypothetical protein
MSNITTRAGKGSPLTNNELDANFTNLNSDKVEIGGDLSGTSSAPNVAKIQGRAVSTDAPAAGEKLVWNGTAWEPSTEPTGEPIGHADKTQSSISFDSGTRTFTIAPVATEFVVWCKGVKYTYTSAQTVVIPNTTGLHFIYFNQSGVLSTQMSYFTWEDHAPTAYVYWNATTSTAVYFGDERHGITLDWQTHEYLHRTRGAAIANGFGASGYTTTGLGATDADAQIDIGGGTFFDEDMQVDIVSTNSPVANTWQQDLSGPARIPVLYLSGNAWVIDAPTDFPFKVVGGIPQYNLYSGGTWSTASVNNNEYFVSWILATNNLNYPVVSIISQAPTNQLSQAEAMTFEGLSLSGFPSVEFRPLYKVIYTHKTGFTNSVKASTVAVYDLRALQSAGVAAALVQDHGNLSGLGDDDHAQYLHVSEVRSPSAAVKNSFLPSQTSNSGKYLSTDGTNPSWVAIPSGSLDFTGDVTGTGTTGSPVALTLANSGVTAGTYSKVTVDGKGRVTVGTNIASGDVTTALGFTPENAANKGVANGYAGLDSSGKIASSHLPSYVDDVLEYANLAAFPATGDSGKIYIAIDSAKVYRWSGSAYVEISASPGSTDAVPEGSTNLYHTTSRVRTSISASGSLSYNNTTGTFSYTTPNSDGITEGSTNLYFTNARARSAVSATGSLSYNSSTGVFSYTQPTNVSTFTNDSGYLTGITGAQVTTALGYTPYNSTNPSGYITSSALSSYLPLSGGAITGQVTITSTLAWDDATPALNVGGTGQGRIQVRHIWGKALGSAATDHLWLQYDNSSKHVQIGKGGGSNNLYVAGNIYANGYLTGNLVLNAGNYNSYALPLSGGTLTGNLTASGNGTGLYFTGGNNRIYFSGLRAMEGSTNGAQLQIGENYSGTYLQSANNYATASNHLILHAGNYTSYSPSLTGTGASGTWGINITGNAATATSATDSTKLPLTGGTLTGTLYFTDSTNGISKAGGRLTIRSEATDDVANFASYGLYLPRGGQTAGLYVQSPIEARGGLRMGDAAGNGTITVGADTAATANRLVQRDSAGDIYGRYFFGVHFNQSSSNTENPSIAAFWTNSGSDNYCRKSSPAHVISQLGLLTTSGGTISGAIRASQITAGGSTNTDANLGVQGTTHLTGTIYYGGTVGGVNSWSSLSTSSSGTHTFSGSRFVFDRYGYGSQPLLTLENGTITMSQPTTFNSSITANGRDIRIFENDSFIEFYVGGDANTYYPVRFDVYAWFHFGSWSISRGYGDTAPWDPIGTGAHRGGLTLTWEWSGDGGWGGNDKTIRVNQFSEQYTTMVGGMALSVNGLIVWLRGGNAYYRFHGPGGMYKGATPYYSTYTASNGATFSPRSYNSSTVASEVTSRMPIRNESEHYDGNNRVLHAGNYTSYSPSLTGSGASGTWGINISGTATYATNVSNGRFDNYSGSYNNVYTWLHFHGGTGYGLYFPGSGSMTHLTPSSSSYGSVLIDGSRNGYWGTMFSTGVGSAGWMTNGNTTGYYTHGYGWKYYHESGAFYISNSTYGGGSAYVALHAGNYTSYAPSLTGSGASGTWGISITGNAATVGGLDVHSGRNDNANKIVRTDGNGYIQAGWINTTSGNSGVENRLTRIYSSYDDYLRYSTLTDFKVHIGESAKNNYSRRIDYTSDSNYWVGSFGHSGYGANETFHGGSGFFDIWSGSNYPSGTSHIQGFNALHYTTNSLGSTGGNAYGIQVAGQYNQGGLLFSRGCSGGSFSSWRRQIDDNNYTDYAVSLTYNSSLNSDSRNSRGVTRLYRRDDNSDYSVQTYWTGSHWYLAGYSGDGFHADCRVAYSDTTGTAARATRANGNLYIDDNYGNGIVGAYASTRYQGVFAMGDSYKLPADGTTTGSLYGMAWSHPNAGGVAGNLDSHGMLVLINGGFGSCMSYSIKASGNVTAYSDERLKTNWRPMPESFVERLAAVKVGIYDRTDGERITQVGVSAQSLQRLLPEAITKAGDEMGTLSVSYGNAAMASAVELAKELVQLKRELAELKSKLH